MGKEAGRDPALVSLLAHLETDCAARTIEHTWLPTWAR